MTRAEHIVRVEECMSAMLDAYWAWREDTRDRALGEAQQRTSRELRAAVVAAHDAGLDALDLGVALGMDTKAAGEWCEVLVRARGEVAA